MKKGRRTEHDHDAMVANFKVRRAVLPAGSIVAFPTPRCCAFSALLGNCYFRARVQTSRTQGIKMDFLRQQSHSVQALWSRAFGKWKYQHTRIPKYQCLECGCDRLQVPVIAKHGTTHAPSADPRWLRFIQPLFLLSGSNNRIKSENI